MLVVSDIDDIFLPKPTDLLVNLAECRASLEGLLGRLGDMFQDNSIVGSAMGSALQAAFKLMVGSTESTLRISLLTQFPLVSHWWQNYRFVVYTSDRWRWSAQKPRRSESLGNKQGAFVDKHFIIHG